MLIAREFVRRSARSRANRVLVGSVAALLLGLAAPAATATPTDGTDTATATADPAQQLCALAASYNERSQPGVALGIIDEFRATAEDELPKASPAEQDECSPERSDALRRLVIGRQLGAAIDKVEKDEDLVRALPGIILHPDSVTLPTSLTCTGEQAATARKPSTQTNDSAPATAAPEPIPDPVTQLLKEQARICDRSAVLAETDDEETFSQSLGKAWKSFTDDYLSPLTDPLLGALGFLAAGVVAALLLVWPLGRLTTWWYVTRSSVAPKGRIPAYVTDRLAATWAGGALLVLTALLVLRWPEGQLLPLYTLLVGVGAVLLGWGLSQSPRLRIKAADNAGTEDHAASAHVAGLVSELCRSDFRSLETAGPAEDTALQATGLTTTPEGKVAAAAYKILELLVPRTPWTVRVHSESPDLCAVTVHLHGQVVTSAVIDRDALGLRVPRQDADKMAVQGADDKPVLPDLHRVCAAVAVAALASRYRMPGLDGASTWEGIGLHFVARTDLRHQDERTDVLAQGLESDPENRPVLLEFWHARYRDSVKPSELELYAALLEGFLQLPNGTEPDPLSPTLRLRASYARYVALINHHYAKAAKLGTQGRRRPPAWFDASVVAIGRAIAAVENSLGPADQPTGNPALVAQIRHSLQGALAWRDMMKTPLADDTDPPAEPQTPWAAYSWACFYASRAERREDLGSSGTVATAVKRDRERAVRHLGDARSVRDYREWSGKDPQLATLVKSREYLAVFGRGQKKGLLEVKALTPHKKTLTRIGATNPEGVLQHGKTELSLLLGTTAGQAGVVRQVAELALSVPPDLDDWRYELTDLLSADGILTVQPGQRGDLVETLGKAMETSLSKPPTRGQLAAWLGQPPATP